MPTHLINISRQQYITISESYITIDYKRVSNGGELSNISKKNRDSFTSVLLGMLLCSAGWEFSDQYTLSTKIDIPVMYEKVDMSSATFDTLSQ